MPIFTKETSTIYFAHIPKTAGTSIYMLFVANGWKISNLSMNKGADATFTLLNKYYGIEGIPVYGNVNRYNHSIQHAPFRVWGSWSPFDTSFAVFRDPCSRFVSSIMYFYRNKKLISDQISNLIDANLDRLESGRLTKHHSYDGHFMSQYHFLSKKTLLFRFGPSVVEEIQSYFNLAGTSNANANIAKTNYTPTLLQEKRIRNLYKRDVLIWNRLCSLSNQKHSHANEVMHHLDWIEILAINRP